MPCFKAIPASGYRLTLTLVLLATFFAAANAQTQLRYSGSDTVEPVVEAAQIAYARGHAGYKLQIQSTGTSVGLRDLCSGRTVLAGASRPITPEEAKVCSAANIQFLEIPVALDALTLVVSSKNTWLKALSLDELRNIYDPAASGKLISWKQVRASFPDIALHPAGPDVKHGTFRSFSESLGLKGFLRTDYKDFSQHNKTGLYVAGDAGAIGFMPYGDARTLDGQVRMIGIDFGAGVVMPGVDEVLTGKYDKFARTVYLYVNMALLEKTSLQDIEFTKMLLREMEKFVRFANLIPLRTLQYQENIKRVSFTR